MDSDDPLVNKLSESLVDELVGAVGLPKNRFTHRLFWGLFHNITHRLALIGVPFDRITAEEGFPAACNWSLLNHFCLPSRVSGMENIPPAGPLLVLSNHPGAYDAFAVISLVNQNNFKCMGSEIPFLDLLENVRKHFIFTPKRDQAQRMLSMRRAVIHLREGGTLLFFGTGHRDPDPAVYPGGEKSIDEWLDVVDPFLRAVKGLKILPTVVSGVVTPRWANHPLTWLRRKQIDKHRLAEFGQVITQLLRPRKLMVTPSVSFGLPVGKAELRVQSRGRATREVFLDLQKDLMRKHIQEFGGVSG